MTVQELIDALQKIKSKEKLITCSFEYPYEYASEIRIGSMDSFGNEGVEVEEYAYVVNLRFPYE